jgi:hypothetical protein
MSQQEKKHPSEVLNNAVDELKKLEWELVEIERQIRSSEDWQPARLQKVKNLARTPEISNKVAETKPKLRELDNLESLVKAVDAARELVRTLKSILISPYREEFVSEFRALVASSSAEAPLDLETGIRNSLKEVDEAKITKLTELIRSIASKGRQVGVLRDQFRDWFSLALLNLHEKEKKLEYLESWIVGINDGVDKLLILDKFLDDIRKGDEALRKVSSLVAKFYDVALRSVEENFKDKKKDAPTHWHETWKKMSEIWEEAKTKLLVINSGVDSLTEAEKQLLETYVQHLRGMELEKFSTMLDNITTLLSDIFKGKEAVDKVNKHINSIKEIDVSKTPFQSLASNLEKLSAEIPSPHSTQTLDKYACFLKEITSKLGNWDDEFEAAITQVRQETLTWLSMCKRKEKLSGFTTKLESLMSDIGTSSTLGVVVQKYLELSNLYLEIKGILKNEAEPVILDAITKIGSSKGSGRAISLSEIEEEVRKARPDLTSEYIAASVANMEANKLIRVEIIV